MELEQRVKVLEQEVKILKNQIQTTLLDIQEQLLVSKYPALRTEDDAAAMPAAQEWQAAPTFEAPASIIHKVTLPDSQAQNELPGEAHASGGAPPPAQNGTDWSDLARLNDWAAATVEKVGVAQAQRLIMMYARRGMLTAEIEEALLEAVEMYAPRNGSAPDISASEYAGDDSVSYQNEYVPEETEEEPKGERNLIMRLIRGLQNSNREVNRG